VSDCDVIDDVTGDDVMMTCDVAPLKSSARE